MTQQDLFEGGPNPIQRELLEGDVQDSCVQKIRALGGYARKFSSPANRSVPDYVFVLRGRTWFVEFKRPGGEPTEKQADEHKAIRACGGTVWVIDDVADFKARLERFL